MGRAQDREQPMGQDARAPMRPLGALQGPWLFCQTHFPCQADCSRVEEGAGSTAACSPRESPPALCALAPLPISGQQHLTHSREARKPAGCHLHPPTPRGFPGAPDRMLTACPGWKRRSGCRWRGRPAVLHLSRKPQRSRFITVARPELPSRAVHVSVHFASQVYSIVP